MATHDVEFDPAVNPAVLDTLTWNEEAAAASCAGAQERIGAFAAGAAAGAAAAGAAATPATRAASAAQAAAAAAMCVQGSIELFPHSASSSAFGPYVLARCPDGQRVFVCVGLGWSRSEWADEAIATIGHSDLVVRIVPVNMRTVRHFVTAVAPGKGPTALGRAPRLGVGCRQTVMVWPGVFEAMREMGMSAEIIQNSAYRELAPMSLILAPPGDEAAYLPGHGRINVGHTGSSVEGLWLAGVVAALENGFDLPFGADLDHVPVKRENGRGLEKTKSIMAAGRDYTFFTLDTSGLFNPAALALGGSDLDREFEAIVPAGQRSDLLGAHAKKGIAPEQAKRYAVVYWRSIEAAAEMFEYISSLKQGRPFDFEFSLDEGPGLTSVDELTFVLEELRRRDVRVDFIAPNVGFEKRLDYRLPDGLAGLEARVRRLADAASEYGALIDFHSGSDKSSATYQCISRATRASLKLKVSGKLQLILAEVLADVDPGFFRDWWDWTLASAREEARQGSNVAAQYVAEVEARMAAEGARFSRSPRDRFFTDFAFGMVGARDQLGRFVHRARFYSLSRAVREEYTKRVKEYVLELAGDLGLRDS